MLIGKVSRRSPAAQIDRLQLWNKQAENRS
jgi:hypothetical protein